MNSNEVFIHIHQGCFAGTGAIVRLPQCQWSKPGGYGKISQCITTTKHSKAKTVCIFLGIYCNASATYPKMHHLVWNRNVHISVPRWCIVRYGTRALWDLWFGLLHIYANPAEHYSNIWFFSTMMYLITDSHYVYSSWIKITRKKQ